MNTMSIVFCKVRGVLFICVILLLLKYCVNFVFFFALFWLCSFNKIYFYCTNKMPRKTLLIQSHENKTFLMRFSIHSLYLQIFFYCLFFFCVCSYYIFLYLYTTKYIVLPHCIFFCFINFTPIFP